MTPLQKGLLVALISRAGRNRVCCVSVKTLAEDVDCDPDSIRRGVKVLEARGLISVERTRQNGRNLPNVYRLAGTSILGVPVESGTKEVPSKKGVVSQEEKDNKLLEELGETEGR